VPQLPPGPAALPGGLALLRRTLGGGLAGVLAEPRSPLTDEITALATEAMEAHLDRGSDRCARARCPDVPGHRRPAVAGRTSVLWFRRDLRTADHPALLAAVEEASAGGGAVAPLFVVDALSWPRPGQPTGLPRRLADRPRCPAGGGPGPPGGRPEEVVPAFAAEVGARAVFATGTPPLRPPP